jgi:hypothetical protein
MFERQLRWRMNPGYRPTGWLAADESVAHDRDIYALFVYLENRKCAANAPGMP